MAIKDDLAKVRRLFNDIQVMAQSAQATKQAVDTIALAFATSDALRHVVAMLEDAERSLRDSLTPYPPETRPAMLRVLVAPSTERAAAIGTLYVASLGGHAAELLIDLEGYRRIALIVADVLKSAL
jgi:hypothetical protein